MIKHLALTVALAAFSATASYAGTISLFSDQASLEGAAGPLIVEDFGPTSAFPINSGVLNSSTNEAGVVPGLIEEGVTFSTEIGTGNFFNIDFGGGFSGGFLDGINSPGPLNIAFDALQGGFGFVTNTLMPEFDITINFSGGSSFSDSFSLSGTTYFGFASDAQDIESVSIVNSDPGAFFTFALDDFGFTDQATSAPAVPLPGSLPLVLAGLAGFGFMARKKR